MTFVGPPFVPKDETTVRLFNDIFDVEWKLSEDPVCKIKINIYQKLSLRTLEHYLRIYRVLASGPNNITVWRKGARLARGSIEIDPSSILYDWDACHTAATYILRHASDEQASRLSLTIAAIGASYPRLNLAMQLSDQKALKAVSQVSMADAEDAELLCYWVGVDIGDITIFAIHERDIKRIQTVEEKTVAFTNGPKIVDLAIIEGPSADCRNASAENLYRDFCGSGDEGRIVISLEDIITTIMKEISSRGE